MKSFYVELYHAVRHPGSYGEFSERSKRNTDPPIFHAHTHAHAHAHAHTCAHTHVHTHTHNLTNTNFYVKIFKIFGLWGDPHTPPPPHTHLCPYNEAQKGRHTLRDKEHYMHI